MLVLPAKQRSACQAMPVTPLFPCGLRICGVWTRAEEAQVHGDDNAATVVLGLPGFVLLAVSEHDGDVEYAIETSEAVTDCAECGVLAGLHDRRPTFVGDLPAAGRPVTLVWVNRAWRCMESDCARRTWAETSEHIPRASDLRARAPGSVSPGR